MDERLLRGGRQCPGDHRQRLLPFARRNLVDPVALPAREGRLERRGADPPRGPKGHFLMLQRRLRVDAGG